MQSAFLFVDLLEFTFIELDFLSFSCATSAVASADASLSAHNSIAQSFSMRKFTVCMLVGMVSQISLKLSYSLPSVDKIRPVSIRSDSVFSLCFINLSFISTEFMQLSDMHANILLAVTLRLEERLS